jgi:hypothetical protein
LGQSLSEYGVIIGLVVIALIVPLTTLGDWTRTLFQGTIRTGVTPPPAAVTVSAGTGALVPGGGATPAAFQAVGMPVPRNYAITLSNGRTLTIPLADPAAVVETAGGSGMTGNALAALDAMIRQLEDPAMQTDPALLDSLRLLSLRGHDIKAAQQLIESHLPQEGFPDQQAKDLFMSRTKVMHNGQEVSLQQLTNGLNNFPQTVEQVPLTHEQIINRGLVSVLNGTDPGDRTYFRGRELMYDFLAQYYQIQQSGLLQDPVLKQLVGDQLTRQIYVSATSTSMTTDKTELKALVQTTRAGSNGICTLSNYTDCQG